MAIKHVDAERRAAELLKLHTEAQALAANTQIIQTQEGRALINLQVRILEVLLHGEARTALHSRNHA